MPEVDALAVAVATVAAFVAGGAYYAILGGKLAEASDAAPDQEPSPPVTMAVELLRCLLLAAVIAGLAARGDVDDWAGGLLLGVALWIGFPLVLWTGAIVHAQEPWRVAAIHAGDWLIKLPLIAVIVSVLQ